MSIRNEVIAVSELLEDILTRIEKLEAACLSTRQVLEFEPEPPAKSLPFFDIDPFIQDVLSGASTLRLGTVLKAGYEYGVVEITEQAVDGWKFRYATQSLYSINSIMDGNILYPVPVQVGKTYIVHSYGRGANRTWDWVMEVQKNDAKKIANKISHHFLLAKNWM